MDFEFRLPELGEQVEAGEVTKILVSVGDRISRDQPVLEIEAEKAVLEVPSPADGTVKSIFTKEGEQVSVGQMILTVDIDGGESSTEASREQEDSVAQPDLSAARLPGRGQVPAQAGRTPSEPSKTPPDGAEKDIVPAAPSARRIARELGIDIKQVTGSGPSGWVSNEDVLGYARNAGISAKQPMVGAPLPDFAKWGDIERKALTPLQRKMAEHMRETWSSVPQVTQHDKADITELEALRTQFAPKVEMAGGKLTLTAILIKVASSALKHFPHVNASVDMQGHALILKKYYNIGVAIDTDRGLVVPVIRHVDKKTVLDLAVELTKVSDKARQGKLTLEDLQGGTFGLSNLGGIGGTYFSPIVNLPDVAILGVSRATTEPIFRDGGFMPRLMLPLSLSYDHRAIDGATGCRFLRWIVEALEQPFLLTLEG